MISILFFAKVANLLIDAGICQPVPKSFVRQES